MHFVCYGQASGKHVFVHIMSLLDGVVDVAGFSALLVPRIGINGVYIANILNGTVTTIAIIVHAWLNKHRLPRNMEELMVIPEEFGVPENQRMDLSLKSIGEVVTVSEEIQSFCTDQGIDERRALLSGLCMEEMAGNVIEHGFALDNRKHSVDVRVARKEDTIILRIKDDCAQFDPEEIMKMKAPDDPVKNIGIRMVYAIAERVEYQSIMGLNVLTIRI
jgi:anti-sigma regulatory factor (Ser/Thr protein kinase)